jgi:protein N-terminal amidase
MKVACLQFAPELGKVEENIAKANKILEATPGLRSAHTGSPLWLVLPEMAFSGNG